MKFTTMQKREDWNIILDIFMYIKNKQEKWKNDRMKLSNRLVLS